MKPLIKDGLIMRDEHGNWTAHSVPLRCRKDVYMPVLEVLLTQGPQTVESLLVLVGTARFGLKPALGLRWCLEDLEKVECARVDGLRWVAIRNRDRKMKGWPFPADHPLFGAYPNHS